MKEKPRTRIVKNQMSLPYIKFDLITKIGLNSRQRE